MSEFITVQVGQCGNQIGSSFWPMALEEYGITSNPSLVTSIRPKRLEKSFSSFFNCPKGVPKTLTISDLCNAKITARALLIDMEEKVVERFQHGNLNRLFDKKCILTNHPGSGNNWAVGHHTHFQEQRGVLEDMLRRTAEQCDRLHGVVVLASLGGGTGSGLGSALVKQLDLQFPLVDRIVSCVHPGQYNDVITSPYNVALSLLTLSEHASCVIPVDNKALGDICVRHRLNRGLKPFQDVNSVVVNMLLNLTSGSRFSGSLNSDISDLGTLVPRPGLNYLSASLSPIDLTPPRDLSFVNKKRDLLQEVCVREDQLLRVNTLGGKLLSAALLCRGNATLSTLRDYVTRLLNFSITSQPADGHRPWLMCYIVKKSERQIDINLQTFLKQVCVMDISVDEPNLFIREAQDKKQNKFRSKVQLADWADPGIKAGLCSAAPVGHKSALLCLANSTNMSTFFTDSLQHFNRLYNRKAHVHHYTKVEGFEQEDFLLAKESLMSSALNYSEATKFIEVPRLQIS